MDLLAPPPAADGAAPATEGLEVLVADDSMTVRKVLAAAIEDCGFRVVEVENGVDAWTRLQEPGAPRLALLDWEMPGKDGPDVCRLLRAREAAGAEYTYVVLLTSRGGTRDLVAGLEAGADDYVAKPFDEHELQARLRAGQRIVMLQRELYRLKEMFRLQSRTDPLTGCFNRRAIMERLGSELSRARREGRPLGVAMVDVDHFKCVNDAHGHAAGDAVLREVVRRIDGTVRASDAFGRTGGEEFLVLWPAADLAAVRIAGERIRQALAGQTFAVGAGSIPVTASVGATSSDGGEDAEEVVARADAALYAAKAAGRDRVEVEAQLRPGPPRLTCAG
jgi:two-component system cell cycle response regulator